MVKDTPCTLEEGLKNVDVISMTDKIVRFRSYMHEPPESYPAFYKFYITRRKPNYSLLIRNDCRSKEEMSEAIYEGLTNVKRKINDMTKYEQKKLYEVWCKTIDDYSL